ncbi:MAG TPA: hypothetical protein VE288_05180 [Rubrobacteraceae bacterium]|nr:hypothetical protein [Rubrobacteraceae bacterium]
MAAKHRAREAYAVGILVVVGGDRLGRLLIGFGVVTCHVGFSCRWLARGGALLQHPAVPVRVANEDERVSVSARPVNEVGGLVVRVRATRHAARERAWGA